jgi:hypothetical protein
MAQEPDKSIFLNFSSVFRGFLEKEKATNWCKNYADSLTVKGVREKKSLVNLQLETDKSLSNHCFF